MDTLSIKLAGKEGTIPARSLADSINALTNILMSLGQDEDDIKITDISVGSLCATVATTDHRASTIVDGLVNLNEGISTLPNEWTKDTLEEVSNLYKISQHNSVDAVTIGKGTVRDSWTPTSITEKTANTTNQILREIVDSEIDLEYLGSISGRLYRYNNQHAHSADAGIETADGKYISVSVPQNLTAETTQLLEKNVDVWGLVVRASVDEPIKKIYMEGIALAPEPPAASPTPSRVRGILNRDVLDGLTPVEWVRRYRAS